MLRSQYGIAATPSSAAPVSHAEDAQPNETIYKRRHGLPPQIGSTWKDNYRGPEIQRGGYGGSWTQYAIRGKNSWKGRGNFQSNRGGSQRHNKGHVERSPHHASVPPIETLPDVQYHLPQTSSSNASSSYQPSMPHPPVTQDSQSPQAEPYYEVQPSAAPTLSEHQTVDDHDWLYRSRSPSPKLPPSTLKGRKVEHQHTHISDSGRNKDSVVSQSIKHHKPTTKPISPKVNKPLLPGRHRRSEDSAPIHSPEPPVQVQSSEPSSPMQPNTPTGPLLIKQEPHTPSPARSIRTERSLITASCKFYPIPELCKKTYPGFKERRKAFCQEKMRELSRLKLKGTKSLFRDDGLAIEWTSKVPVWSDTLQPDFPDLASAIKRAYEMNYSPAKSTPKRKRQSVDRHSRESKRPRHSPEVIHIADSADEIEIIEPPARPIKVPPSPAQMSSLDHSKHPSTTVVSLLDTSELICLDPEAVPDDPHDAVLEDVEPLDSPISVVQQQKTSAMDIDTPTQLPKPARRMLFKPVHPLRRNQLTTSPVHDSTLLTSDSAKPFSTSVSTVDGYSKTAGIQVDSRSQDNAPQHEKATLPLPRLPLPSPRHRPVQSHPTPRPLLTGTQRTSTQTLSKGHAPTPPPPHLTQTAEEVEQNIVSRWKDEDNGNATDPDADLVVNLLLRGTPEETNRLSNPHLEEIKQDLQLHVGHEADDDAKDDESMATEEDTAAVEYLATQFLQQYLQLFDVNRSKLETAYTKNALFSCRVHHHREPSLSMAGLFAPESKHGFNVSRSRASIQKGRAQIVSRLLELGPHSFCPRGVPGMVTYDVVPLPLATGGGILLTVHGVVVSPHLAGPQMDHILSVDQSFVLRNRESEDQEDRSGQMTSSAGANNVWPLVAVSHQMTVRDVVLLPLEQLASQIQDP